MSALDDGSGLAEIVARDLGEALQSQSGWIYAVHRQDGSIAYVGQTIELPALRFASHVRDALRGSRTPFHLWLRGEAQGGHSPRVSTLETCPGRDMNDRERFWIRFHHAQTSGATLNVAAIPERMARHCAPMSDDDKRKLAAGRVAPLIALVMESLPSLGDGPISRPLVTQLIDDCRAKTGVKSPLKLAHVFDLATGSGRYDRRGTTLVRVGTSADVCTSHRVRPADRVREFLRAQPPQEYPRHDRRRGFRPARVSLAATMAGTLMSRDECHAALAELGWSMVNRRWRQQ